MSGSLISYQDHTINIVSSGSTQTYGSFTISNNVFNFNGIINQSNKYSTYNKLILDGGAKYLKQQNDDHEYVYFVD